MNKPRAAEIVSRLQELYPNAKCSLDFKTPLQLAVATILSAQATDASVNKVTPALFKKYRSVTAFAEADFEELANDIRQIGLFRAKAKNIIAFARTLSEKFGGKIPKSLEELQSLPGVGRKTANVIKGVLHGDGNADGIAVDTHVTRLSFRLGFTKHTEPKKIEADLQKWVDREHWVSISHMLILHGREVCSARKPNCTACTLSDLCPKRGL